jgi:hypothetical protein
MSAEAAHQQPQAALRHALSGLAPPTEPHQATPVATSTLPANPQRHQPAVHQPAFADAQRPPLNAPTPSAAADSDRRQAVLMHRMRQGWSCGAVRRGRRRSAASREYRSRADREGSASRSVEGVRGRGWA